MSTIWTFDNIENKHTLYCGEDCMKKFCTFLREHATNVINFEKRNMLPLTKEGLKAHQDPKACHICGKRILKTFADDKNYQKFRDHWHFTGKTRGGANVANEIAVVFDNGYHFIIKELANESEGQFGCFGENTEK